MKRKFILIPALGLLLITGVIYSAQTVSAKESEENYPPFLQRLRSDHHEVMQAKFEERLNQAVLDGRITPEQKQLILDKHQELLAYRSEHWQNMHNLTEEERQALKAERQAEHDYLEDWAEENGINLALLMRRGYHRRALRGTGHGGAQ